MYLTERFKKMKKLEAKELKKGLLIWWKADRLVNSWNCPAIVTNVSTTKNEFTVLSLDDFKESVLAIHRPPVGDPSSLTEMRLANKEEVEAYIRKQKMDLRKGVIQLERQLELYKDELARYIKKADKLTL
jgi:hypothetical protein